MLQVRQQLVRPGYWAVTVAAFAGATALLLGYTPTEATMGPIQKVFYLHLPLAINTFLAALVVFVASIGYLVQRSSAWDDLAAAAAKVAVVFCSGVLITGMIWGRAAWGQWWTWSPRLTFSLILWLLYAVYLMVRSSIESRERRAMAAAVYGLTAFLDVPLVWLSARLLPDIHPASVQLAGPMKLTLIAWFVPVTLAAVGLIGGGYELNRRLRERERTLSESRPAPRPVRIRARAQGGVA
jgi:heme exporter protein C